MDVHTWSSIRYVFLSILNPFSTCVRDKFCMFILLDPAKPTAKINKQVIMQPLSDIFCTSLHKHRENHTAQSISMNTQIV